LFKQVQALSPLIFYFSLEYALRELQENKVGLKLNEIYQLLFYVVDVNLLGDKVNTARREKEPAAKGSTESSLRSKGNYKYSNVSLSECSTKS
jgi:hypothetical protein